MANDVAYLAPRPCLASPIPEIELAADMLSDAVDALMAGQRDRATELLAQADMPVLRTFSRKIMDVTDPTIQRRRKVEVAPGAQERVKQRKPSNADRLTIHQRDGFRCRYCGCRVVLLNVRKRLRAVMPEAIPIGKDTYHAAFLTINATLDHVLPHARGGDNSPENLVTTCWPCNYGKEHYRLEELGLIDPRLRPPVVDAWDGLQRLLPTAPAPKPAAGPKAVRPVQPKRPPPEVVRGNAAAESWHDQLEARFPGAGRQVLAFAKARADLGVDHAINKECVIRLKVNGSTITPLAILRNGDVNLPWYIGPHKAAFRPFAERVAATIAGAVAYETPKNWSVRMHDKRPLNVDELLAIQPVLVSALIDLRARLLTAD